MVWLEGQLAQGGVPVRRWQVEPGLEDLEVQMPDRQTVRLRVVRTAGSGGGRMTG